MKKLLLFCIAAGGFLCGGGEIEFLPGDAFRVEHALFKVIRYTAGWKASVYPGEEEGDRLQLIRSGESFEYRFHSDPAAPTASLSLQMTIPAYRFFGKPVIINDETEFLYPEKTADSPLLAGYDKVKTLDVPLSAGILKFSFPSPISVHLLDFRMFQLEDYALRLLFSPTEGEIARANLKFRMRYVPYPSTPLNLRRAANMGFADEKADDRKGGWTDQGPDNDLSSLKPGTLNAAPARFEILDPAKNGGKACIALGGGGREYFPREAVVPGAGKRFRTLFLLHALAWARNGEIGSITLEFLNGSSHVIPVSGGRDVGDWWNLSSCANGSVAWRGFSREGNPVGLFLSAFPVPDRPIRSIRFKSNGNSVWMVAGVSGSTERAAVEAPLEWRAARGGDWRMFESEREIEPGSALDFSFLLDAPAGKHGRVVTVGDHFELEKRPGVPIRFYGVNICMGANFVTHEEAEILAERLSRIGYNAVRFHHFDETMTKENLDGFFYLWSALKKRGVYLTLDCYIGRVVQPYSMNDYKLAAMLLPEANNDLREFCRMLLATPNPYTGTTLGADPACLGISIINENSIFHNILNATPEMRREYDNAFAQWAARNSEIVTDANRKALFHRFLREVYANYFEGMKRFFGELGVTAPLTDQNYIMSPSLVGMRSKYDYVDNHQYWDHPVFPEVEWQFPVRLSNLSALTGRLSVPAALAPARVLGKPYTVTEFDYCYPNACRAEGAVLTGSYAALQNWSGLFRFDYSNSADSMFRSTTIDIFDVVNDPVRLLSERIGMALFTRGDVTPAEVKYPIGVPAVTAEYIAGYPRQLNELALIAGIGSQPEETLRYPEFPDGKADSVTSATGELKADFRRNTFSAVTPRSEAFVLPEGATGAGKVLEVTSGKGFGVYAAISLDGAPLAESGRLLVLQLTDVLSEGARFASADRKLYLERPANSPGLLRHGTAEISLALPAAGWKLHALGLSGKRLMEVPFQSRNGKLSFHADNFAGGNTIWGYELVRDAK